MARKKAHEEHANHEAWAIPYGDLLTLLLALFVVLYSMSSVNEGKYRVLSDSLNEAFGGRPRSSKPIQIGDHAQHGANAVQHIAMMARNGGADDRSGVKGAVDRRTPGVDFGVLKSMKNSTTANNEIAQRTNLQRMSEQVQAAMGELIAKKIIKVRQTEFSLEIEIATDILFPSGVAELSPAAVPVLDKLAGILKPFPNPIRVEGHTDNLPISTLAYPSNWQLSSARAASVVALFVQQHVEPVRMSVAGFGEFRPVVPNDTAEGRNRNRRVQIVVLSTPADSVNADLGLARGEAGPAHAEEPAEHVRQDTASNNEQANPSPETAGAEAASDSASHESSSDATASVSESAPSIYELINVIPVSLQSVWQP